MSFLKRFFDKPDREDKDFSPAVIEPTPDESRYEPEVNDEEYYIALEAAREQRSIRLDQIREGLNVLCPIDKLPDGHKFDLLNALISDRLDSEETMYFERNSADGQAVSLPPYFVYRRDALGVILSNLRQVVVTNGRSTFEEFGEQTGAILNLYFMHSYEQTAPTFRNKVVVEVAEALGAMQYPTIGAAEWIAQSLRNWQQPQASPYSDLTTEYVALLAS